LTTHRAMSKVLRKAHQQNKIVREAIQEIMATHDNSLDFSLIKVSANYETFEFPVKYYYLIFDLLNKIQNLNSVALADSP